MKRMLTTTAVLEGATGLAMLALPALVASFILGSSLDTAVALTVARVAGVAILALGVSCWLARHDERSRTVRGLAGAMALYNAGVSAVFVYGALGMGLSGIGLWPTVLAHAGMTVWCVMSLLGKSARLSA